jgi:hypothetical protein
MPAGMEFSPISPMPPPGIEGRQNRVMLRRNIN